MVRKHPSAGTSKALSRGLGRFRGLLHRNKNRRLRTHSKVPPAASAAPRKSAAQLALLVGKAMLLLVAAGACGGGFVFAHRWLTRSPHFAIREIRISPLRHVSEGALRERSGITLGENLFAVSLADLKTRLLREPWIASVRVHRELPQAIAVDVVEREAACAVALEAIYLADAGGMVFKRATPEEAASLPVVTGIARDGYVHEREVSQSLVREGLATLDVFREKDRFVVGELHVDQAGGAIVYGLDGMAVRLGRGDRNLMRSRLARLDAVLAVLSAEGARPALVDVDQMLHPERVTVRLLAQHGG